MANPFVAEIRIFAGNFAPTGWALCNGQLMAISQNTALFSLLGTTYGGDGKTTFALPNFQGMAPMHAGQGPGLSARFLGETAGEESVTLLQTEVPQHRHQLNCDTGFKAENNTVTNQVPADKQTGTFNAYAAAADSSLMPNALAPTSSLPHENRQPYLTLTFIIALQGVFPARN